MIWTDTAALPSDPLAAVRMRLLRAEDQLLAGDWDDAGRSLRSAAAALDGACASGATARFAQGGLTPNQQRRLVRHIEADTASPIKLEDLARVAGLSRSHFCRMFHMSFGAPPLQYVQHRRIARAMELMLSTEESLAAIALECGLYDQAALCKVFRRITGETPAAWRRRRRA